MDHWFFVIALYSLATGLLLILAIAIAGDDKWKAITTGLFVLFFFLYSGVGMADERVRGLRFIGHYVVYASLFVIFFILVTRVRTSDISTGAPEFFSRIIINRATRRLILGTYLSALLIPLTFPEFRLNELVTPPALDFVGVFSDDEQANTGGSSAISRYISIVFFSPAMLALGTLRRQWLFVGLYLTACMYIEYVNNAYISRSSILLYFGLYFSYLVIQYRHRLRLILAIASLTCATAAFGAAYFLTYRLGIEVDQFPIAELMGKMVDVELNFARDAGAPLYESGVRGSVWEYIIWILTLPIPKIIFGRLVDLRINENIAMTLTGLAPGDIGFTVPLPGALFASIYSLGNLFWIEPVLMGCLAGISYRIVSAYRNSYLLKAFIAIVCSYFLNRSGAAGSVFHFYNTFFWLMFFWTPLLLLLASLKLPKSLEKRTEIRPAALKQN
jgi:hypothetical protein